MKKLKKQVLSFVLVFTMIFMPAQMTVFATEGEDEEHPISLTEGSETLTIGAGEIVYYSYQKSDADKCVFTVEGPEGREEENFFDPTVMDVISSFYVGVFAANGDITLSEGGVAGQVKQEVSFGEADTLVFYIWNSTEEAQEFTCSLEKAGTWDAPAVLSFGVTEMFITEDYVWDGYFYEWVAPKAGTFSLKMNSEACPQGWYYNIDKNGENICYNSLDDGATYAVNTFTVAEGDRILLTVNIWPEDMSVMEGTVTFTSYFEADEKDAYNASPAGGYSYLSATTEGKSLYLDGTADTTLFLFKPEEEGTYIITVDEALTVSDWGSEFFPENATENPTNTLELTCESVGQSFLVGIAGKDAWTASTIVAIDRRNAEIVERESIVYENKANVRNFTYVPAAGTELEYVNIDDDIIDTAVLGADGYYHLNSANGSVLYINLKDDLFDLTEVAKRNQLKAMDASGMKIVDYNEAFWQYAEATGYVRENAAYSEAALYLYPLTEDLITIMQEVGNAKGWYTKDGAIGSDKDDAWMALCWYEVTNEIDNGTEKNPFTDVAKDQYYYNPVLWASKNNITSGLTAIEFAPEEICTRGQIVTFLWRANGRPEPINTKNPFIDVNSNEYYYKAVLWAYENGITTGLDSSHFAPEDTVTRGEVVTFLYRAEKTPNYKITNSFVDVSKNDYYYNAVLWAYENGITTGLYGNYFAAEDFCTRGQVVTFLYRALSDKPSDIPFPSPSIDNSNSAWE